MAEGDDALLVSIKQSRFEKSNLNVHVAFNMIFRAGLASLFVLTRYVSRGLRFAGQIKCAEAGA